MEYTITAMEARKKFGEMLNRVSLRQEEIIIERAGKQIAKLTPVISKQKIHLGKLDFRKSAGLGQDVWQQVDVTKYIQKERKEWE